MSHERTPEQLAQEIEHLTGEEVRICWMWFYGLYLEVAGSQYSLGLTNRLLSPADQESICRAVGRPDWIVLLGLDVPESD